MALTFLQIYGIKGTDFPAKWQGPQAWAMKYNELDTFHDESDLIHSFIV